MATGQMILVSGDGYVSVVQSCQSLVILVGLVWLAVAMGRPGLVAKGSVWAADTQVRRWRNPWLWGILIASALVLAGQVTSASVGALMTFLGYGMWVVIFGRDIASLASRFRSKLGGFSEFKKALDQLPPEDRNGMIFGVIFLGAFELLVLVAPCFVQGQLTMRQLSATLEGLSVGLQLLLVLRALFENLVVESSICLRVEWYAPGSLVSAAVFLSVLGWAVVSVFFSKSSGTQFFYGAPLVLAHILVLAGWGRASHPGAGGTSSLDGSAAESPR